MKRSVDLIHLNRIKMKGGMMKNRKGLSDVISTVLIVLLALAAIAIVWGFVKPAIDKSGKSIDTGQKCIEAEVKPISCGVASTSVTYQYVKGGVSAVNAYIYNSNGALITNGTDATVPGPFGTDTVTVGANPGAGSKLRVSAVVKDADGQNVVCNPHPTEISCA